MKAVTLVIVLFVLLGSSMAMASVGSSEKTSSLTSDHLINGGFETGTFAGWWVEPDPSVADISETIVHSGLYSAHISDEKFYYNWIQQDVYPYERVTPEQNLYFEGWIYPSRVGKLYGAEYPFSSIRLRFYNETSMLPAFVIHYTWCMSATWYNFSRRLVMLIPCEAYEWNRIARNVTRDIHSYFANTDF
ncbi:MAG: hypothetical protein JSW53_02320, partial [Candidatus Bathyarchaeota archaeon]